MSYEPHWCLGGGGVAHVHDKQNHPTTWCSQPMICASGCLLKIITASQGPSWYAQSVLDVKLNMQQSQMFH